MLGSFDSLPLLILKLTEAVEHVWPHQNTLHTHLQLETLLLVVLEGVVLNRLPVQVGQALDQTLGTPLLQTLDLSFVVKDAFVEIVG